MTLLNISTSTVSINSTTVDNQDNPTPLIPSYAHWYEKGRVDDIERRALPDLFLSDPTPATYTAIRDFMVESSRQRPQQYLTIAYCRRMLNADIGIIYRVHAFLEQWGLINYQVNTSLVSGGTDVVQVQSKTKPLPENIKTDSSTSVRRCAVCGSTCQGGYYTLAKQTNILCDGCFADGKLFEGTNSSDYHHIDTPQSIMSQERQQLWSEEEELRLLEAIEEHSNDWAKIASVVGRSKEACLLHFLQLDTNVSSNTDVVDDTERVQVSPFAHLENPVIGTISFLASLVHPKVAAAAAKAAISTLSENVNQTEAAAVTAFAMAACKANELAKEEERIIQQLRDAIVLTQMKKVQLKLSYLESLERNVLEEKAELEKQRMVLFLERVNLKKAIMGMEGRFVKREEVNVDLSSEDIQMHVISDNTK